MHWYSGDSTTNMSGISWEWLPVCLADVSDSSARSPKKYLYLLFKNLLLDQSIQQLFYLTSKTKSSASTTSAMYTQFMNEH